MDENKEVTRGEQLRRALVYDKKNGYDRLLPGELEAMEASKIFRLAFLYPFGLLCDCHGSGHHVQ